MGNEHCNAWAAGLALLAVGVLGCGRAPAVEFKDIAGKWCTSEGSEQFDRDNLIAIPASTNEPHVYPIERYDFRAKTVIVVWRESRGESYTIFANFSADNHRMIQLKNAAGPRREFHRC